MTVLVVGGGNGGISLAARLRRDGVEDVELVSDSPVHAYRPLLNYVGAGQARMPVRPMRDVLPPGVTWIEDAVTSVDPTASTVGTASGRTRSYDVLVLAPGLTEDWAAVPGLRQAYDDGWAASTFVTASAPHVWPRLRDLRRGRVVFTVPPEPAPCGPTALKPLFLACDHWRRTGVLADLDVHLVLPTTIGVERADAVVDRYLDRYGVTVHRTTVTSVGDRRLALADGSTLGDVTFAHVVPPYRPPAWIAAAGLAADGGLVAVDPTTLRHRTYDDVWALGDAADTRTRPSGGALRPQVDVLARNLAAVRAGGRPTASYDGYTVAPVTVSRRRALLVEHDRDGRLQPSVPVVDLLKPRWSTWFVDRFVLPVVYVRRILRGKV